MSESDDGHGPDAGETYEAGQANVGREPTAYEKRLRTEARQYRLRAQEAERQRDETVAAVRQESDSRISQMRQSADQRVIRAELKAHAVKAGIVDLDGLRLLNTATLRLTDTGDVDGAEALIGDLKASKPWLFGADSSSSSARAPTEQPARAKRASEMSVEEWRAARADLIKRR